MLKYKIVIFVLYLLGINLSLVAQDIKAGELTINNVSGKTYQAKFKFYYQTSTFTSRPYILVNWGDGSALDTVFFTGTSSACGVSNSQSAIYTGIHTFSNNGSYVISCTDSFRVANIQNITNSASEKMFLQYQLNVNSFLGSNDSPFPGGCALYQLQCCGWAYNSGEIDNDGDSLSYSLVPPFTTNYSFPTTSNIDQNGTFSFTPSIIGSYAFCMKVDEWRKIGLNNYLMGSSLRELFFEVSSLITVEEINSSLNQFNVYPNPTQNTLHIKSEQYFEPGTSIEITNTLGQTVLKLPYRNEIDVSGISNGCYFLKITTTGNRTYHTKFVKQ